MPSAWASQPTATTTATLAASARRSLRRVGTGPSTTASSATSPGRRAAAARSAAAIAAADAQLGLLHLCDDPVSRLPERAPAAAAPRAHPDAVGPLGPGRLCTS